MKELHSQRQSTRVTFLLSQTSFFKVLASQLQKFIGFHLLVIFYAHGEMTLRSGIHIPSTPYAFVTSWLYIYVFFFSSEDAYTQRNEGM
ncbi:hypothetical protein BCR41DRAFT_171486 [Lobosporangium transversale]|uniref:Uncharacterized protein n=1 Tax=Lobosporangium transversale TaxID=64571 RepID=A0A1Y2GBA9_9FUNG|nr:hypothetical protein BCR41DRAFT_171486 [Lobosporangium transversale]ORZ06125.1 hypothetical protein BCR41DRAFT_171486 [Lobosporangium transversale]|eukprot:XP_021877394.1 hypothetical protein BCR41DRAFT_171486 [Lobosporangium transversale]